MDRFHGQLVLVHRLPVQRMHGMQQPHREGGTRSDPAAGRQVAEVMDFQAALDAEEPQDFPGRGMRDLVHRPHVFDLGINDQETMVEEGRQVATGQVTVPVDRRRQDRPAVLLVPGRVVCAATQEGNAEESSGDDHRLGIGSNSFRKNSAVR